MLRFVTPFLLDVAPDPYHGGPEGASCIDSSVTSIIIAVVFLVLLLGVISLVRAVKAEKRAKEMKASAEAASQLLDAINEAQKTSGETNSAE